MFVDFLLAREAISNEVYELLVSDGSFTDAFILEVSNLSELDLVKYKSIYYELPYINLDNCDFLPNIKYATFKMLGAFPFYIDDSEIRIAITNPENLDIKDKIQYEIKAGLSIKYFITTETDLNNKFHSSDLLSCIMVQAIKNQASDVHITPCHKNFTVMFRINGDLVKYKSYEKHKYSPLSISSKVRAKLDISETRRPQSGQFNYNNIDCRLSTHPTIYGENIVIRLLNKEKNSISIDTLGFNLQDQKYLIHISKLHQGIIIFCGPTGSGKTTSIYSLINLMDKDKRNIMTLEDPVEYHMSNVRQTEIKSGIMNFADGIRSILRQDPDVILIGEIRDEETAKMAIRASMTGHLVLTTIHANDSLGAIFRLNYFNIPLPFISENIIAIISQRLVKKKNNNGRTIISEILRPNEELKNMIATNKSKLELLRYAQLHLNFKTIDQDAKDKIQAGIIDADAYF